MNNDKILSLLRSKGPLVPNEVKKVVGGDTMIVGAMLSELANRGFVKISHLKKGGSPFYYLEGQEAQLEKFTEYLNPKDQKTQQHLKEQKILRDKSQELFYRVSLRQIKDFAKAFTMQTANGDVLFWRYYLLPESQAKAMLLENSAPKEKLPEESKQSVKSESAPAPSQEKTTTKTSESKTEQTAQTTTEQPKQTTSLSKSEETEKQKQLVVDKTLTPTPFYEEVRAYFARAEINVKEEKTISKNREYQFIIQIPSAVGHVDMLCIARNKKKLNQNDVAPALLKAKQQDLPCFFLTNGEFTKKSKDIIAKEYKGVIVKTF